MNRKSLEPRKYQICSECVMDTSDSKITFDENGRCDFCQDYHNNILKRWDPNSVDKEALNKMAKEIKKRSKGAKYDCIIGFSGGIDSSYCLYVAKVLMGLNPLAYICDTGWNTEFANNNIKTILEKLNIDSYVEKVNWEEMKDLQVAFLKSQVPYQDLPQDLAIFAGLYNYAAKHNIKCTLTGANLATESIRPPLEWVYMNDTKMIADIHKKYGTIKLKTFPWCNIFKYRVIYRVFKGIKRYAPLDLMDYDKTRVEEFLINQFGWHNYSNKHYEDIFTRWYEGYYLPTKFGFDKRRCYYSNLIHLGEMTRDEALKLLSKPGYSLEEAEKDTEYIAKKLGLDISEFKTIIKGENKTYKDYKNSYNLMKFFIAIARFFGIAKWKYR